MSGGGGSGAAGNYVIDYILSRNTKSVLKKLRPYQGLKLYCFPNFEPRIAAKGWRDAGTVARILNPMLESIRRMSWEIQIPLLYSLPLPMYNLSS